MKISSGIFILLLLGATFSSCLHDSVYDPEQTKGDKVTDLKVPAGFDWETSDNIRFSVVSAIKTKVSVFTDAGCQNLIATLPASETGTFYNLEVGREVENLYVQYPADDGRVGVVSASLLKSKSVQEVTVKLPEDVNPNKDGEEHKGVIYYPGKKKWGSVFFEDMWPKLGDYDFNDVAVWYQIRKYLSDKKENKVVAIEVSVRLNALGGLWPYQLGLQLEDLEADRIRVESDETGRESDGYTVKNSEGKPVILFDWPGRKGSYGGKYYNTEEGFTVPYEEIEKNVISFKIYPEEEIEAGSVDMYSFNFFIRNNNGMEIHLKGYEPTADFREEYHRIVSENDNLNPDCYYTSKDGFVWGLKVPDGINHAKEEIDFRKAYQHFEEWVTSNGEKFKNWFEDNEGHDNRVNVKKNE